MTIVYVLKDKGAGAAGYCVVDIISNAKSAIAARKRYIGLGKYKAEDLEMEARVVKS